MKLVKNYLQELNFRVMVPFLFCICLLCWTGSLRAALYVTADAAVVIDAETGEVLYDKNMHQRRPPASTTKIMTTILGIELGKLNDQVKTSPRAAAEGGSSIWLKSGEVLTLEELLYGVMLNSGNDAAVAVAEYISGSVEEFAILMNRKAKEIGALNTTFKNPNGLPNDQHLTTAYDLAMIMRYAMQNEIFREITSTAEKRISWPGQPWPRVLRNFNKLLWMYRDADGGKTGYTRAAGRCLVSTAIRNGRRVVSVILHTDQRWQDSIKLLDYGLNNYQNTVLLEAGEVIETREVLDSKEKELEIVASRDFIVTLPKGRQSKSTTTIFLDENLRLPILKGQKIGWIEIQVNGKYVGQVDLLAKTEITPKSIVYRFWKWISSLLKTIT